MSQLVPERSTVRHTNRCAAAPSPERADAPRFRDLMTVTLKRRALLMAAGGMVLAQLYGCASKPKDMPAPAADAGRTELRMNPPVVISGNPKRDAVAFNAADEELSDADWQVLEQIGPKPMWQQITGCRSRRGRNKAPPSPAAVAAHDPRDNTIRPAGGGPSSRYRGPLAARHDVMMEPVAAAPAPTTQPTAAPVQVAAATPTTQPTTRPATQPTTQPTLASAAPAPALAAALPPIPEDDLPVQVIELPDNKLRMIWTLQSYGGAGVKTTRNDAGGTTRRTVEVQAPDLAPLVSVLTAALGQGSSVTPLPKENTLVITCDRTMRRPALQLLSRLDTPQRQVEITAKIFEVSQDFDFQQGANVVLNRLANDNSQTLISTFSAKRFADAVAGGNSTPVNGSVLKLMQTFADAGLGVDVSFQLLAEAGLIKVVSEPRMTVAVGQTGYLLAGQELPIQSANIVNNVLQTTTSYKPVGVQLYITPQSAGEDRVKLHTISIVSSVSGFSMLPNLQTGNDAKSLMNPIIDSREAETQVTIGNGDTLVISGLRMIRTTTREEKVPGLGDLPVLGWAFKNHRSQQQLTDLYFFVTPVLLDTSPVASASW